MLELERQSTQRETDMRSAALRRVNEEGDAMSLQMQVRGVSTAVRLAALVTRVNLRSVMTTLLTFTIHCMQSFQI